MAKKKTKNEAEKVEAPEVSTSEPAPAPRLFEYYKSTVCAKLLKEFEFANPHQVPRLLKIVLNVGLGDAQKNPKQLESVVSELSVIAGQRPVITKAKKAISNFALRTGVPVGASVTLRGAMMWEFLDRFISVTVPRIRDFRGFQTNSMDGRGNYSIGIKEQMAFPEIDYDKVEKIHGMDITFVTDAGKDDVGMALLRELGMPFRGQTTVRIG
jgi:large subunit ribosomal protein L5